MHLCIASAVLFQHNSQCTQLPVRVKCRGWSTCWCIDMRALGARCWKRLSTWTLWKVQMHKATPVLCVCVGMCVCVYIYMYRRVCVCVCVWVGVLVQVIVSKLSAFKILVHFIIYVSFCVITNHLPSCVNKPVRRHVHNKSGHASWMVKIICLRSDTKSCTIVYICMNVPVNLVRMCVLMYLCIHACI